MKKSFFIIISILFFGVCTPGLHAQFGGGSGTAADPWLISSAQHLDNLRNYIGTEHADKYYLQTCDIDLGIAPYNQGEGWSPVGEFISLEDWSVCFYGNFNGNHHIIRNLYIRRPDIECQGLFGVVCGSISNLGVIDADVLGGSSGIITGCFANANITNCYSSGVVVGTNHHAGGIAGMGGWASISCCHSSAYVTSGYNGGGLFGDGVENTVSNCYSTGNVNGGDECTGGFTGWASTSTFSNCYSTGHVAGGVDGEIGGFVGHNHESDYNGCYWNTQTSGQSLSPGGLGRTTDEMTYPYDDNTFVDWDFTEIWTPDTNGNINNGYPYLPGCTSVVTADEYAPPIDSILLYSYPNPFNLSTTLAFDIPKNSAVKLLIYNVKGQKVKELLNTVLQKGTHSIVWDGRNENHQTVSPGIYFLLLEAGEQVKLHRAVLMK